MTKPTTGTATAGEDAGPVEHHTYCRFCISLCGVVVTTEGQRVTKVVGDRAHPVSQGYTCPKGRALGHFHHHADRLDDPQIRRDGTLTTTDWDSCLDDLGDRLQAIVAESGPDAVGVYLATASAFDGAGRRVAERLVQQLGTRSKYTSATVDTACKPLVSELLTGYPGLVTTPDHQRARLTLLFGSNPVLSHGHTTAYASPAARLKRLAGDGELWVIDPRRTESARLATRHLAIRPGTDYAVLAHVVRELLADGADTTYLTEHAENVEGLRSAVAPYDLATAAARAGIDERDLTELVAAVRRAGRVSIQTGTGLTMSAAANVSEWLVWALHVVTGSFERPGGTWFNPGYLKRLDRRARGGSDGTPQPGPRSRPELPARWGEYPCAAVADEIEAGNLRALVVVGGNPVTSLPDVGRLVPALRRLEVLAVADVVTTATTDLATHVLPCTGQLERADLPVYTDQYSPVTSSQWTDAVLPPGGRRRAMWWIVAQLGRRLGLTLLPDGLDPDSATDTDLLRPIADRGTTGYDVMVAAPSGLVDTEPLGAWVTERLLPGGRWRLAPEPLVSQLAGLTTPPPLVLIPRRQLRHLNSQLTGGAGPDGRQRDPVATLVHPYDAREAGLADGDHVELQTASGTLRTTVTLDADIRRGAVSVPHGYSGANVGALTSGRAGVDPLTGMVLQSGVAVRMRRIEDTGSLSSSFTFNGIPT
jgi:anaerobic selenocysteine-containing dehydrogenase